MYEKYFTRFYQAVDRMMNDYRRKDLNRNRTNYGTATAYASVLRDMGHEVEINAYGDGDYLITDKITVDGKVYDFFH